jgi:branched-chain amino acid transport system ATP-binding protein
VTGEEGLLECREIVVSFGGNRAVDDVSFEVRPRTLTGLIGPNGAGKTTLFNVITGLLSPRSGRIRLDGRDITRLPPHKRAQRGLARTFQRLELFTSLTVSDNLRVAGDIRNHWGVGDNIDVGAEVERIIELVGLQDVADREVSEIPTGTARVVEVGRALMTKPRMLLLDEPASGQTEQETEGFGRLLRVLVDEGLSICLVEHDMTLVMGVCDQIYVLDYGKVIASGPPEAIRTDPAVIEAYLGAPAGP